MELVDLAGELLLGVSSLRQRLWENAENLLEVAEEAEDFAVLRSIHMALSSSIVTPLNDQKWGFWRLEHNFEDEEANTAPLSPEV